MDRAKAKKMRNIRVIATNIFMSISVVAIVFVLMLVAMALPSTNLAVSSKPVSPKSFLTHLGQTLKSMAITR